LERQAGRKRKVVLENCMKRERGQELRNLVRSAARSTGFGQGPCREGGTWEIALGTLEQTRGLPDG